ncbi:MAG: tyrosine-protein phosphatase [Armatimonadetes bacterium]|nr:tyrosine-protein phosphatase [Armatimonadota bacterium]
MFRRRPFAAALALLALAGCRPSASPPVVPAPSAAVAPPPPVAAPAAVTAATSPAPLPPHEGLPNFHLVEPGIYRGAAPTAQGLKSLKAMGVKTIIDLRIEVARKKEKIDAEALGFRYIGLPMGKEAPTKQQITTLLETLKDTSRHPVYVHCQHGADRTGCMIGLYRETVQGWSFDKTWAEMRRYGFNKNLSELKGTVQKAGTPKAEPK